MDYLNALKERIKAGNEKLIAAWPGVWDIQDQQEKRQALKKWDKGIWLLVSLCMELMYRFDFRDCVYLDKNGHKTKPCIRPGGFYCFVCPSETPYWRKEAEAKEPVEAAQKKMDSFWGET